MPRGISETLSIPERLIDPGEPQLGVGAHGDEEGNSGPARVRATHEAWVGDG